MGYSLPWNQKSKEGPQHPDRDRQFRYIHLQQLTDEIGMPITVSHYPPGTSKWNKRTCRGRGTQTRAAGWGPRAARLAGVTRLATLPAGSPKSPCLYFVINRLRTHPSFMRKPRWSGGPV